MACQYNKTKRNEAFHALNDCLCFHHGKILLFSSSPVPDPEAGSVVPESTTKDKEHRRWCPLL